MHMSDGNLIEFKATDFNRLYTYHIPSHLPIHSIMILLTRAKTFTVDTVAAQSNKYTKRQLKAALAARNLENIIIRPRGRKFTDICLLHFKEECSITKEDFKTANDILGKNLGSLKGKTVHKKQKHVKTNILPVPPDILKIHKEVTLGVDIMFVNKIPFLITISRNIHFGTVEELPNRKLQTVKEKLKNVINIYAHRGFNVSTILADGEFEPMRPWFPLLNTCAENEHVPEIERFIRTIKNSTRSIYQMLLFTRIPRLIVI